MDIVALVEEFHGAVYRYAYRLSGNEADADDLTQQAFVVALEKGESIHDAKATLQWLFVVTRRLFLRGLELRKRAEPLGGRENWDLAAPEERDSLEDHDSLDVALASIPQEVRTMVVMYYMERLSYQQIASALQIPIGTVMSRLSRAKEKMRSALDRERRENAAKTERASGTRGPIPFH